MQLACGDTHEVWSSAKIERETGALLQEYKLLGATEAQLEKLKQELQSAMDLAKTWQKLRDFEMTTLPLQKPFSFQKRTQVEEFLHLTQTSLWTEFDRHANFLAVHDVSTEDIHNRMQLACIRVWQMHLFAPELKPPSIPSHAPRHCAQGQQHHSHPPARSRHVRCRTFSLKHKVPS